MIALLAGTSPVNSQDLCVSHHWLREQIMDCAEDWKCSRLQIQFQTLHLASRGPPEPLVPEGILGCDCSSAPVRRRITSRISVKLETIPSRWGAQNQRESSIRGRPSMLKAFCCLWAPLVAHGGCFHSTNTRKRFTSGVKILIPAFLLMIEVSQWICRHNNEAAAIIF